MFRRRHVSRPRVALLAFALACVASAWPRSAHARRYFRARFEPTTLALENPGNLEIDLQVGAIYGDGQDGSRLSSPDFEVDLGILPWLEVDVDGGFSLIHVNQNTPTRSFVGEPLWTSAKATLFARENAETGGSYGAGLQVGPRLPSLRTAPGVGFAGVFLVGGGTRRTNVVVNVGTALDRGQSPALVYGVDVSVVLDHAGDWSLVGELGGAHYFGPSSPEQLLGTLGFAYQASPTVGVSLIGLGGFLHGNDRLGLLAGLQTVFGIWKP